MTAPCHCCWPCMMCAISRSLSGTCAQNHTHCARKTSSRTPARNCAEPNRSPLRDASIHCECNKCPGNTKRTGRPVILLDVELTQNGCSYYTHQPCPTMETSFLISLVIKRRSSRLALPALRHNRNHWCIACSWVRTACVPDGDWRCTSCSRLGW